MLDELTALGAKLAELAGRVRALREENHELRRQLAATTAELTETRGRVENATRRIDALVQRLAADANAARN
jgi:predicted  nucleic acid-binding Zn-ribbon protein